MLSQLLASAVAVISIATSMFSCDAYASERSPREQKALATTAELMAGRLPIPLDGVILLSFAKPISLSDVQRMAKEHGATIRTICISSEESGAFFYNVAPDTPISEIETRVRNEFTEAVESVTKMTKTLSANAGDDRVDPIAALEKYGLVRHGTLIAANGLILKADRESVMRILRDDAFSVRTAEVVPSTVRLPPINYIQ